MHELFTLFTFDMPVFVDGHIWRATLKAPDSVDYEILASVPEGTSIEESASYPQTWERRHGCKKGVGLIGGGSCQESRRVSMALAGILF